MYKVFNYTSITLGVCIGFIASLFGGCDKYIKCLFIAMVLDFITGIIKSVYSKNISSDTCIVGIFKKVMMLVVVCVAVVVEEILNVPVRYITIMFFLANECISILENASVVIPLPKKLVTTLDSIREVSDSNNNDDDNIIKKK